MFKTLSVHTVLMHLFLFFFFTATANASGKEEAWKALQQGEAVAIMRHAHAPNTNEVSIFKPEKCAPERNISSKGAEQSREVAKKLRANKIDEAKVYSTSLCRGMDTAMLLDFGEVTNLPEINSYYETPEVEETQTNALKKWIFNAIEQKSKPAIILVTHKFNITSLTGTKTEQGDIIIIGVKDDELVNLHQFSTPIKQ